VTVAGELSPTCYAQVGCSRPRMKYSAYCPAHAHVREPEDRVPRCVAPLRCYCPVHGPQLAKVLTMPMSARDLTLSRRLEGNRDTAAAVRPVSGRKGPAGAPVPADLAGALSGPVSAPFGAPEPSHAAARRMSGLPVGIVRSRVFVAVARAAAAGATDDDLERHLQKPHQTVSSARNFLVAEGWLEDSGRTRMTRSGRAATVWVVATAAADAARVATAQNEL
jgi:hypothetical protein